MKRVIAHTDPDELTIIKIPRGWRIGEQFEPRIVCLCIDRAGRQIDFEIPDPISFQTGYTLVDLDGATGIGLTFFLEIDLDLDQLTEAVLFDQDVKKSFKIVLVKTENVSEENVSDRINPSLYMEIVTPEVLFSRSLRD